MKLLTLKFLTGIFAIISFAGCGGPAGNNDNAAANQLRIATSFRIQHLDPLKSGHYFLVEFGAAELPARPATDGKIEPWLLESFEQIDKLNWKLKIRPGVTFQNGKPLTAENFARAMNRQIERSPETKVVIGAAQVKVNGPDELILQTTVPNPNVPAALADETVFPVYDAETVEAAGADSLKLAGAGVYTGPYKIAALTEREMSLERHEKYWRGTPPFERVAVLFVSDPQARILAVQNGEANISLYPQTQNKRMLDGRTDAFYSLSETTIGGPGLIFNLRIAPFDDEKVRRAVGLGIDYESLANETMDGIYRPADGFYPAEFPWAKQNQRTDVEAAKKLLDDSGWQTGTDDLREKNGEKLSAELLIYPQQADFAAFATAIQAQLRRIGFDVKIRQVDDIQSELKQTKNWNFAILGATTLSGGGAPEPILRKFFHSESDENRLGIADAQLDEKIDLLGQTFDAAERGKILGEIQDILIVEKAYVVRVGFARARAIVGKGFKSYEPSPQLLHVSFETKPDQK